MRTLTAIIALTLGAYATPALANDGNTAPSGPRIEAIFGYDRVEVGVDDTEDFDANAEDVTYGANIGYDFSRGMISFGVEAEISTSNLSDSATFNDVELDGDLYNGVLRLDSNPDYYIGGRLGFGSHDKLVYIKAGYAMSSIDIDADGTVNGVPDAADADIDLDGLRLGIGFEYGLLENFYMKTEYRFTDYSGGEVEFEGQSFGLDDELDAVNVNRHQVVVGAGLRF
ncbi:outer membrane protein [Erythrobacter sp.]|jgi:outer membrane immunogenic protein|uniref:outer membrane protein n=1 Tax=Erythrobacter sp. TaxID=1042 RepID=UPI002EA4942A|nr:outer membrane beta-barrel protein [Erythrobacter sp.]